MMKWMPIAALALLTTSTLMSPTRAALQTRAVEYKQGETLLEGYLAWDDAITVKRPGVLAIHEWMGIGPNVKKRAEMLAALGYVAFAADIYGKGVRPKNREEAGAQAKIYRADRGLMRARAQAGLKVLQDNPLVDATRLAAIGYCFGGGAALELARSGAPVNGVASFHGNLDTPYPWDAKNIKSKILILHGADDPSVPIDQVVAFRAEMNAAKIDYQLIAYGGAVHSFTNPEAGSDASEGNAYNANADRRSWQAMRTFFNEIFAPAAPQ